MSGPALAAILCTALTLAPVPDRAPQGAPLMTRPLPGGCTDGPLACYNALVDAYMAGNDDRSVGLLLEWDWTDVVPLLEWDPRAIGERKTCDTWYDRHHPWDARRYAAAVMLHTDAAFRLSYQMTTAEAARHLDLATRHIARGLALRREGVREIGQRWFVAVARCLRDRPAVPAAASLLKLGRERLPMDPAVLVESGILAESIAAYLLDSGELFVGRNRGPGDLDSGRAFELRQGQLNEAATWLRQAVDVDPSNDAARLHLGRVLFLRMEDEESLRVLREVAETSKVEANAYLASLFSAAVHHRAGRLDEAARSYSAAVARWPAAPAAYLGLSEALQGMRKGDESREILGTLLALRSPDDPFWLYLFDQPGVADRRLGELRSEVRR